MPLLSKTLAITAHRFRQGSKVETTRMEHAINKESSPIPAQASEAHFFTLPTELQLAIIGGLPGKDVLRLRLTCRAFYSLTEANQSSIVRRLSTENLKLCYCPCRCKPPFRMMPGNPLAEMTFNGYYNMIHRDSLIARLCDIITDFVERKILRIRGDGQLRDFESYKTNFWKHTHRRLRHLLQWLVEYHKRLVEAVESCTEVNHIQISRDILQSFGKVCLMDSYGLFQILLMVITMSLRTSSYATKLERTLRRRPKPDTTNEDVVRCLLFGGLDAMADILSIKEYRARRAALESMVQQIEQYAREPTAAKPKHQGRISRIFTNTGTTHGNISKTYKRTSQNDAPKKSALPEIDCTVLPKVSPEIASKILKQLPDLNSLFITAAEKVLFDVVPNLHGPGDIPSTMSFVPWAMIRNSRYYIFELLSRDVNETSADDDGTRDTSSEDGDSESEDGEADDNEVEGTAGQLFDLNDPDTTF